VRRGDIWTVAGSGAYAGKPRPAVIVQNDGFGTTKSITIVPLTTNPMEAPLFRLVVEPNASNGLRSVSHLMADKITTIRRRHLGRRLGTLSAADMLRLERAILVFLGLAE
jgi:mRNA interferase MazF